MVEEEFVLESTGRRSGVLGWIAGQFVLGVVERPVIFEVIF
jgi:hypothetical protein